MGTGYIILKSGLHELVGGGLPSGWDTPTLWVNGSTGNDSNSRAAVLAGNGAVQWATLWRAVYGCAPGGTPSASEAAAAGDLGCYVTGAETMGVG